MQSALPLLLFFGFLFGSTLLILICGVQNKQLEVAEQDADPLSNLDLQSLPRFFGRPGQQAVTNPVAVVVDEAIVLRVESFLREELALAEVFVDDPSVDGLHHQVAEPSVSLFERLERFLKSENEAAADFVSNPSIESLYGQFGALPVGV